MRMLWNKLIPGLAVIAILMGMGIPAAQADGQPEAFFLQTRFDFESVMEGEQIRHDFIIENRGRADLVIERVQPD